MTIPPRDPNRPVLPEDQRLRETVANELPPRPSRFDDTTDNRLQADPEMAEGPAGFGRIAIYAVAAIVIVCGLFYGITRPSTNTASNTPPTATTATNTATPPPVRNVTPGPNSQPGTTTGAATSTPPSAPTHPANPPAGDPGATPH